MQPDFENTLNEMRDMQDYVKGRLVDKDTFKAFVQSFVNAWERMHTSVKDRLSTVEREVASSIAQFTRDMQEKTRVVDQKMSATERDVTSMVRKEVARMRNDLLSLRNDLASVESNIPEPTDLAPVYAQIGYVEGQIPKMETLPEVWDAIESLKDEIKKLTGESKSKDKSFFVGSRGDDVVAGSNVTVTYNSVGQKVISSTGGSGGVSFETPTGDIDGVNTVYAVAHEPTYIIINGVIYFEGVGYAYSGGNITTDFAPETGSWLKSAYA